MSNVPLPPSVWRRMLWMVSRTSRRGPSRVEGARPDAAPIADPPPQPRLRDHIDVALRLGAAVDDGTEGADVSGTVATCRLQDGRALRPADRRASRGCVLVTCGVPTRVSPSEPFPVRGAPDSCDSRPESSSQGRPQQAGGSVCSCQRTRVGSDDPSCDDIRTVMTVRALGVTTGGLAPAVYPQVDHGRS